MRDEIWEANQGVRGMQTDDSSAAEEMVDDMKPINYYVTGEDCELLMQEGDEQTKKQEAERKDEERRANEEKQRQQAEALGRAQRSDVLAEKNAASSFAAS